MAKKVEYEIDNSGKNVEAVEAVKATATDEINDFMGELFEDAPEIMEPIEDAPKRKRGRPKKVNEDPVKESVDVVMSTIMEGDPAYVEPEEEEGQRDTAPKEVENFSVESDDELSENFNVDDMMKELSLMDEKQEASEDLTKDIDDFEEPKNEESAKAFKNLKEHFKRKEEEYKTQIQDLQNNKESESLNTDIERLKQIIKEQEQATLRLKDENKSLLVYKKRYDLESLPEVSENIIQPMTQYRQECEEILKKYDAPAKVWEDLMRAKTRAEKNDIIDPYIERASDAADLKELVYKYKELDGRLSSMRDSEAIDAELEQMRRSRNKITQEIVNESLYSAVNNLSSDFPELMPSPDNKDHNEYAVKKIRENVISNYNPLIEAAYKGTLDKGTSYKIADISTRAALTDYYKGLNSAVFEENRKLREIVVKLKTADTPSITQSKRAKERPKKNGKIDSIDDFITSVF